MVFKLDQKSKDELRQHWEHLVRLIFPPEAEIQSAEADDGFCFRVAWRLGESESFTENWSREIDIVIPREAIDAYLHQGDKGRSIADGNLVSLIELRKSTFHPEHDTPRYHVPPTEEWRVKPEDLITG